MEHAILFAVDFLDEYRKSNIPKRDDWRINERLASRILKLKYVTEVEDCFGMWFRMDPETNKPDVALRRLQETKDKVQRILDSYK